MKKITTSFFVLFAFLISAYAADFTVTGSFPSNNWVNNAADYKMTEIGTSGVYSLEKTLPAGTYEYKVFNTGTWTGPDGSVNRVFTLSSSKTVKFYAKLDNSTIRFFCDAQQLYAIGSSVGGWAKGNMKALTNAGTEATYTADVIAGDFKIVSLDKNSAIVWNDITPANLAVSGTGNYTLKLDYSTFSASATSNGTVLPSISTVGNSYIFVGADPLTAQWYNGSATFQSGSFNGLNLGSVTSPIYIGGEITTTPVLSGVTAKLNYQIDNLTAKEIVLPFNSNDGTTSSKWKSTTGVNVFTGYSLTIGQAYSLKIWFSATDGTSTLYDSNNSNNYVATFTYDLGTGYNENFNNKVKIITNNNSIVATFNGQAEIQLYTTTGQLIRSAVVSNEFTESVKSGAYILRFNGESHKVIIK